MKGKKKTKKKENKMQPPHLRISKMQYTVLHFSFWVYYHFNWLLVQDATEDKKNVIDNDNEQQ